ncbi:MAG TPA: DUF6398 domain-containing protein [Alphaproteobacteria bacterium]|nr:DUF6398 domain-containing protein [Alphaproteobacteria bacterium]
MRNYQLPKVPETVKVPFTAICDTILHLCETKLNQEYFEACVELSAKLARKRPSPLLHGNIKTWTAGVVHAIGLVNFLFDKSQTPYMSAADLCDWFELGQSTINGKSKVIRDMFKMSQLGPKWCLPSRLEEHPTVWLVSVDGYIIDIRDADKDLQLAAYEAGVIPYLPGHKNS